MCVDDTSVCTDVWMYGFWMDGWMGGYAWVHAWMQVCRYAWNHACMHVWT